MVRLGDVERDLRRQLFLQQRETLQNGRVASRDVDEEVVLVERLELDLNVRRLHDLVNLAVLLTANEFAVLVRKLDLEADLVMESLKPR